MSTPIRQLVRRALSPNILRPPRSPIFLNVPSPIADLDSPKSNNFVKCLHFPNTISSPNDKTYFEESDLGISVLNHNETKSFDTGLRNFNITINDSETQADSLKLIENSDLTENQLAVPVNRELPLVNTPDREELMENGTFAQSNLNILGKGSYGTVIQAIYKGQQVAVKIISNKKPYGFLIRETNALQLHHANIVKTIQVICEPLAKYGIVMMQDCSDAKDMQHLLDDPELNLPFQTIVKWIADICAALQHCHERGILHLDVKPKNILVQDNNHCTLCDFGSSLDLNCAEQRSYSHQGTVAYTAPELFQAKVPDSSADVYSLGITMWQIQSRSTPYEDVDNQDAVVKHGVRPTIQQAVNLDYQILYMDCWAADPTVRPMLNDIILRLEDIR
ncbi:Mos oncogene [Carabus blaptoides fortunei]